MDREFSPRKKDLDDGRAYVELRSCEYCARVDAPGLRNRGPQPGRRVRRLRDIPAFGAPVELLWRVRRWRCVEPSCPIGTFTNGNDLAFARAKLTTRAAW